MRSAMAILSGWGNFTKEPSSVYRPEKQSDLERILASAQEPSYIPRGKGRSYGDASLNADGCVILMTRLNRFLEFDTQTRIVHAEAGVTLSELLDVFVPRGLTMPVLPGTRYVTIGGAIANDVHGKNHHRRGTFSQWVTEVRIMLASGEIVTCSREVRRDLFWATTGGLGLTGIIIDAKIQLQPLSSWLIDVQTDRLPNLGALLDQMDRFDDDYEYSVAWIDGLQSGEHLGRAVLLRGNHSVHHPRERVDGDDSRSPLKSKNHRRRSVALPNLFPSFLLNTGTAKLFNEWYYRTHPEGSMASLPLNRFLFPLDRVEAWNRAYGRRGLLQYHIVLPSQASRSGLSLILKKLSERRQPSFLGVLKRCGPVGEGLLSFPREGFSLALDMPARHRGTLDLLDELDAITLDHGGRVYLAKDARISRRTFENMYPNHERFKQIKHAVDPTGRFASSLARRLGLTEA